MNENFEFAGHTFEPLKHSSSVGSFAEIFNNVYDKVIMTPAQSWDYKCFYQQAQTDMDIFLMDGKFQVIAFEKGLYIFTEESQNKYCKYQHTFYFLNDTKETYIALVGNLKTAIGLHIKENGPIEGIDVIIPYTTVYKDEVVTERITDVFLDGKNKLYINTDTDCYCEQNTDFSVSNLLCVFEYIMKYKFRDFL